MGAHYGHGIATKPDLDRVFAQDPDVFTRQIEKGGDNKGAWEEAQTWAKKIKDADEEYESKIKELMEGGTVSDNINELADTEQAKKDYLDAKGKYDRAFEAEKAKLEASSKKTVTSVIEFPTAEEVKNLGDKVSLKDIKEYEARLSAYETTLKNARAVADKSGLNTFKTDVVDTLWDFDKTSRTPKSGLLSGFTHKRAMNQMVNILDGYIENLIPEINNPKQIEHELKLAGKDYKPGSKNYRKFVNKLNEDIRKERLALREQILGEKIKLDIVDPKTNKVTGQRITYKNVESFVNGEENTFNRMIKLKRRLPSGIHYDDLKTVNEYNNQLKQLGKNKTITVGAKEAQERYLNKMIELAKEKEKIENARIARADRFFAQIGYTQKLQEKIEKSIRNNPYVQSTYQKLRNFVNKNEAIKGITNTATESTTLTEDEIKTKAEEAVKAQREALAEAENKAKERLKELGKAKEMTREEAIEKFGKKKEEFSKSIREEAEKALKDKLEKLKLPNKTWTGLAAGATLALAGGLIGMTMKKDA